MKQQMMGWQWRQLDHVQIICTSLQVDNEACTLHLIALFLVTSLHSKSSLQADLWHSSSILSPKLERWGASFVIYLERGANNLHKVQLTLMTPHQCYLSGAGLPRLSWKNRLLTGVCLLCGRRMRGGTCMLLHAALLLPVFGSCYRLVTLHDAHLTVSNQIIEGKHTCRYKPDRILSFHIHTAILPSKALIGTVYHRPCLRTVKTRPEGVQQLCGC